MKKKQSIDMMVVPAPAFMLCGGVLTLLTVKSNRSADISGPPKKVTRTNYASKRSSVALARFVLLPKRAWVATSYAASPVP